MCVWSQSQRVFCVVYVCFVFCVVLFALCVLCVVLCVLCVCVYKVRVKVKLCVCVYSRSQSVFVKSKSKPNCVCVWSQSQSHNLCLTQLARVSILLWFCLSVVTFWEQASESSKWLGQSPRLEFRGALYNKMGGLGSSLFVSQTTHFPLWQISQIKQIIC